MASVGEELLKYLLKNPDAEDTLQGIAEWWIRRQRVETAVDDVRTALADLVRRGLLVEKQRMTEEPRYRLNRSKIDEIRSVLAENDTNPESG